MTAYRVLIILNSKSHTNSSITYYLDKEINLVILCHSQAMFHNVMKTLCSSEDDVNQNSRKLVTTLAKDDNENTEEYTEGGFTFLILTGMFDNSIPLKTVYKNVYSALSHITAAILPKVSLLFIFFWFTIISF